MILKIKQMNLISLLFSRNTFPLLLQYIYNFIANYTNHPVFISKP